MVNILDRKAYDLLARSVTDGDIVFQYFKFFLDDKQVGSQQTTQKVEETQVVVVARVLPDTEIKFNKTELWASIEGEEPVLFSEAKSETIGTFIAGMVGEVRTTFTFKGSESIKPYTVLKGIEVTKTEADEQGNTVVHLSDGSSFVAPKGDKGEQGDQGETGLTGETGPGAKITKQETDEAGNTVVTWNDGTKTVVAKGDKGETGAPASITKQETDEAGNTVLHWNDGTETIVAKGDKGDKGDTGETGKTGLPAKVTKTGVDEAGNTTVTFNDGTTVTIAKGADGVVTFEELTPEQKASLKGDQGEPGKDGQRGQDGRQGVDGKSAYEVWLEAGNEGSEADFLASLKGAKGAKGDPGDPGPEGEAGTRIFKSWSEFLREGGRVGDYYLDDTKLRQIVEFLPDSNEWRWSQVADLKGPQGNPGKDGADGKDIKVVHLTRAEYKALSQPEAGTVYFVKDEL